MHAVCVVCSPKGDGKANCIDHLKNTLLFHCLGMQKCIKRWCAADPTGGGGGGGLLSIDLTIDQKVAMLISLALGI